MSPHNLPPSFGSSRPPFAPLALSLALLAGAGCASSCEPPPPPPPPPSTADDCDAGDAAFVREATLSVLGRRPLSEAEVQVGVAFIAGVDALGDDGRAAFAARLLDDPAALDRFSAYFLDALNVPRTGVQELSGCYGAPLLAEPSPALGATVRDADADAIVFEEGPFNFADVLQSSLLIDDVTPVYRAHLYALLTRLNGCGNVDPIAQELSYRESIGTTFNAAYLDRDPVCLTCHNSRSSVTDRDAPADDRHWPLPGTLEEAVFGSASSVDAVALYAPFRVADFALGGGAEFPTFNGEAGYCFDGVTFVEAVCLGDEPQTCSDGFDPFCLSPLDTPTCVDGALRCANTPFCTDPTFVDFTPGGCDGDAFVCAAAADFPLCGDGIGAPFCQDGQPACPASPDDGGGGGGGGGIDPEQSFAPWGAEGCGVFSRTVPDDPAEVDGRFASLSGRQLTVRDLDRSLRRGVDLLREGGLAIDDQGVAADPDAAFAYLVAMRIVDGLAKELWGAPLTISTRFPRNAEQAAKLQELTDAFVESGFSWRSLVTALVTDPLFNLAAPAEVGPGCAAYPVPALFDPWVRDEPEAERRNNSSADGVFALSPRVLLTAAHAALGWPAPSPLDFPGAPGDTVEDECFALASCEEVFAACSVDGICCGAIELFGCSESTGLDDVTFQQGIGVFHGVSEKGFRGLDFQARLTWEARYGACEKPEDVARDFIDDLVDADAANPQIARDVIAALQERLVNETAVDEENAAALREFLNVDAGVRGAALEGALRRVCGALLLSPQFLLGGLAGTGGAPSPLSPKQADACAAFVEQGAAGFTLRCDDAGALQVSR